MITEHSHDGQPLSVWLEREKKRGLGEDYDYGERLAAFRSMGEPAIDSLVEGLRGKHAKPKLQCAKQLLADIGGPAVPAVIRATKSEDPDVRRRACAILGGMRWKYAFYSDSEKKGYEVSQEERDAYLAGLRPHLPEIFRVLIAAAREPSDRSSAFYVQRALRYGSLERVPIEVLSDYLAVLRDGNHCNYDHVMSDAIRSGNAAIEGAAWEIWDGTPPVLKKAILSRILSEISVENETDRSVVAAVFTRAGLAAERASLLVNEYLTGESIAEVTAEAISERYPRRWVGALAERVVREADSIPPDVPIDMPGTIIETYKETKYQKIPYIPRKWLFPAVLSILGVLWIAGYFVVSAFVRWIGTIYETNPGDPMQVVPAILVVLTMIGVVALTVMGGFILVESYTLPPRHVPERSRKEFEPNGQRHSRA